MLHIMKKTSLIFCGLLFFSVYAFSQKAEVIKFDQLNDLIRQPGKNIRVINFWATWCGPCVKELPYIDSLGVSNDQVDVHLISLDFADKLDRVNVFIDKKNVQSPVLLLDEIDYNSWIDKVDKSWSGAIPATLIINPVTGKRKLVEKELQKGDLEQLIAELSN